MRYLTNNFWRMTFGLAVILVLGLAFLVVCQIYSSDSDNQISPENYVAGS